MYRTNSSDCRPRIILHPLRVWDYQPLSTKLRARLLRSYTKSQTWGRYRERTYTDNRSQNMRPGREREITQSEEFSGFHSLPLLLALKKPGNYDGQSTWHASETCYFMERNLCVKKYLVTGLMFLIKSLYKYFLTFHQTQERLRNRVWFVVHKGFSDCHNLGLSSTLLFSLWFCKQSPKSPTCADGHIYVVSRYTCIHLCDPYTFS